MMRRTFFYAIALVMVVFISSCTSSAVITREQFDDIEIGMTFDEVKQRVGEPYDITRIAPDLVEYLYIERIERTSHGTQEQCHYIFNVRDGKVESKSYKEIQSSFDLYAH